VSFLVTTHAFSASLTLAWDPAVSPEVTGSRIHQGPAARNYVVTSDVGSTGSATIANLSGGTAYHFAVTAYDMSGLSSSYSNEVVDRSIHGAGSLTS
jgi:hypothetical protein